MIDITIFAVNIGLRQMELIKLQWQQISFTDRILILDNQNHITKGKKVGTIPMNSKAWDVLDKRFKNNIGNTVVIYNKEVMSQDFLSNKFASYVEKAKINSKLNF